MGTRFLGAIIILLALVGIAVGLQNGEAATSPIVSRIFYLSRSGELDNSVPLAGTPVGANITRTKIEFGYPAPVLSPQVTISGHFTFSLWINSTAQTRINLNATFTERLLSGSNSSLPPIPFSQEVTTTATLYKLNGTISPRTLALYSRIFVSITSRAQSTANVTLLYGSSDYSSFVILPLSAYLTLSTSEPVKILDNLNRPADQFDLNSTSNRVYFQANAFPAFGPTDLQRSGVRLNLTVVGPGSKIVYAAPMSPIGPPGGPTYPYFAAWEYPANSVAGTYQVNIDILDGEQLAYRFDGPSNTFVLFRGLFLPPPLNLLPYFAVGGAGVIGGVLYYRRRKERSYLAPFDYFSNLTAGEIQGGTVVAIEGNTGSGKTLLTEQLMFEDLRKGRPCVFVATADFPSNIRTSMKSVGLDVAGYESSGLLTFVDGYSSEAGQESREKFSIPSLGDLTTLGVKITSSLPSGSFKDGSLYFDSLTPLASKAKPESIVSFVQSVGARVKGMSGKAFFTVGPSVDTGVQRQLEELSDCVVQMEAFEESGLRKSRLRVAKFRARKYQQGWALYTIEAGKGIIFYSKKPRK